MFTMNSGSAKCGTVALLLLVGCGFAAARGSSGHHGGSSHAGATARGGSAATVRGARPRTFHGGAALGLGIGVGLLQTYPYAAYPTYSTPPGLYPEGLIAAPPGMSVVDPGAAWYFCVSAQNYYPYVSQCPEPWQMVPR